MAKKIDNDTLRAMLAAEYTDALAATNASKLSQERADASSYYKGDMSKDMPALPGRSQAVSMDVSDTVEGTMPQLMEVFAGSDEVVRFDPVGPEDVEAAAQETDYVNHVFMNQNPGFMTIYQFLKDGLLQKVGIVKVWWEKREELQKETYYGKTDDEFALLASDPEVEIIEHSSYPASEGYGDSPAPENDAGISGGANNQAGGLAAPGMVPSIQGMAGQPQQLHDVTVQTKKDYSCAKVMGVPPEEFGIERGARSIRDCNYCFHKVVTTPGQLIAQGYDEKQVGRLNSYKGWNNTEETARDTIEESTWGGSDNLNDSSRRVEVVEHYIRMDYEGNNNPLLYKVTAGGVSNEAMILKLDGKDDIQQIDAIPFASWTPIPISHRFFGRSYADLVMDVQRIKTALTRGLLDNIYQINNFRTEVAESHAGPNTLDDLLVSRPGGVVRVKAPGGLTPLTVQPVGTSVYPALEYFDATREWRTGVTKQGQGIDANALQNQSATAVNQAFTASQARVQLVAKIAAETGVRDMFWLLHGVIKKHADKQSVIRLRNTWVTVDPRNWKKRDDLTIQVGLGTGGKQQQAMLSQQLLNIQKELLMGGKSNIVSDQNLYNALRDFARALGKKDINSYFTDPTTQPRPQPPMDPKLMEIQMKTQMESAKAQVDAAHQQAKLQADATLEQQKFEHDRQLAILKAQLDVGEQQHRQQINERKAQVDEHVAMRKLEIEQIKASHQIAAKQVENDQQAAEAAKPDPMAEMMARMDAQQHAHQEQMAQLMKHVTAPKRIIRDKHNKVAGVETVLN